MKHYVVITTACADCMPIVRSTLKAIKQGTTGSLD